MVRHTQTAAACAHIVEGRKLSHTFIKETIVGDCCSFLKPSVLKNVQHQKISYVLTEIFWAAGGQKHDRSAV